MNRTVIADQTKIIMDTALHQVHMFTLKLKTSVRKYPDQLFLVSIILIAWFCILGFIRSIQLAHQVQTGTTGDIIIFCAELSFISLLFYVWFSGFFRKTQTEDLTASKTQTTATESTHQNKKKTDPVQTEIHKKQEEFSFVINSKENTEAQYRRLLHLLGDMLNAGAGIAYIQTSTGNYTPVAGYALPSGQVVDDFVAGEGLTGQAVMDKKPLIITDVPNDQIKLESGLGKCVPVSLIFIPVLHNNKVVALIELESFNKPEQRQVEDLCSKITSVFEKNKVALNL